MAATTAPARVGQAAVSEAARLTRAGHTVADVAAELGVSPATVARYLAYARAAGLDLAVPGTRQGAPEDDWRQYALCRDEDPDLFFPEGTSGPAERQVEEAKAVCRRCAVMSACLAWALETGQDAGVWGGASEEERRVLKRQQVRRRVRTA
jgi:WhiB family redox-sensing transcriptional regulator